LEINGGAGTSGREASASILILTFPVWDAAPNTAEADAATAAVVLATLNRLSVFSDGILPQSREGRLFRRDADVREGSVEMTINPVVKQIQEMSLDLSWPDSPDMPKSWTRSVFGSWTIPKLASRFVGFSR
jgi:hypothetical protein